MLRHCSFPCVMYSHRKGRSEQEALGTDYMQRLFFQKSAYEFFLQKKPQTQQAVTPSEEISYNLECMKEQNGN